MEFRYSRIRRHLTALFKYATLRRLWNFGVVEYERLLRKSQMRGYPYVAVIDPLNICNLKCPFCPTGKCELPIKPGRMSFGNFQEIVERLAPYLVKLILYNWGEPFLHSDIIPMIDYAHRKKIATVISSNLNIMPEGGAEALVRSGLDDLIISCDGLTQETYEVYRRGGKLEKVLANLHAISEARKKMKSRTPVIEFQFLVFRHNEHEVKQVAHFARKHGADFARIAKPYLDFSSSEIQPAANPENRREQSQDVFGNHDIFSPDANQEICVAQNPPPISCYWPWRAIVVNWNGQIDPCCGKNYLQPFGNILSQSLDEIWNGDEYKSARDWIAGRKEGVSFPAIVCRGCPGYK